MKIFSTIMQTVRAQFTPAHTIDSMTKKCNTQYASFQRTLTLGHYRSYVAFKFTMADNFLAMRQHIESQTQPELQLALLERFSEQLTFLNSHPFSCGADLYHQFVEKHLPYEEKIKTFISKTPISVINPRKMKP